MVVVSIPSNGVRALMEQIRGFLTLNATIISLVKGLEAGSLQTMTEVIATAGAIHPSRIVAISGPNLSVEIARHEPTGAAVAGQDSWRAGLVASRIHTHYFRPYVAEDIVGVEIGGVVKNIIAMAVGAAEGLGLGVNSRSFLITRGLAEMVRLGVAMGAKSETFLGLAGLGDLVATCSSSSSRNFFIRLSSRTRDEYRRSAKSICWHSRGGAILSGSARIGTPQGSIHADYLRSLPGNQWETDFRRSVNIFEFWAAGNRRS